MVPPRKESPAPKPPKAVSHWVGIAILRTAGRFCQGKIPFRLSLEKTALRLIFGRHLTLAEGSYTKLRFRSYFKTYFSVTLNEVKDLELLGYTRFFAALRMTRH
jgi:hypothetical protein